MNLTIRVEKYISSNLRSIYKSCCSFVCRQTDIFKILLQSFKFFNFSQNRNRTSVLGNCGLVWVKSLSRLNYHWQAKQQSFERPTVQYLQRIFVACVAKIFVFIYNNCVSNKWAKRHENRSVDATLHGEFVRAGKLTKYS